jgi:hypothetical protein
MNSSDEIWFVAQHPRRCGLIHSGQHAVRQGPGGRNSPGSSGQTTFADEISGFEERDDWPGVDMALMISLLASCFADVAGAGY